MIPGQTTPNWLHESCESSREVRYFGVITLVDGSIAKFKENTCALAIVESSVILICYSGVYHQDIMLIMIMKVSDEFLHLFQWV